MSIELHNRVQALEARIKELELSVEDHAKRFEEMAVQDIDKAKTFVKEHIGNWPKRKDKAPPQAAK